MRTTSKTFSTLFMCGVLFASIPSAAPKSGGMAKGRDQAPRSVAGSKQEEDRGKTERETHRERERERERQTRIAVGVFTQRDQELIRRHFRSNQGSLPPGLAKRNGDLPPGLEKQLKRNGHLPPGLEKRLTPFPIELERKLPPLREGLVRGVFGDRAIIMERKTSRIVDIINIR